MGELTPGLENYLKVIWEINSERNVVRVRDIAKRLGVKPASVVSAIRSLIAKGLVKQERYGYIILTEEGSEIAKWLSYRKDMLVSFFSEILGLKKDEAEKIACDVEHYINDEVFEKMSDFIRFINECPKRNLLCFKCFKDYKNKGRLSLECELLDKAEGKIE